MEDKTDPIVYRGVLVKSHLKTLFFHHFGKPTDETHDPQVNEEAVSLIRQKDGNWKGYALKHGKLITVREAKPEDALTKLITHA